MTGFKGLPGQHAAAGAQVCFKKHVLFLALLRIRSITGALMLVAVVAEHVSLGCVTKSELFPKPLFACCDLSEPAGIICERNLLSRNRLGCLTHVN